MIENILNGDQLLAVIIKSDFNKHGITFVTQDDFLRQMAIMYRIIPKVM